ncbi:High-affinity branched-chain amino acid transport ATP-binding protein LivF [wastewater metagenome]|uniref:High-affinity branched-chain amino acid transport ATP-binding protein LivF n=3 Tax=root TaxID=1 RepID=A0A5B8RJT8_9ZZZZ|nr:ATP-binding cassette domain-containing protein [Arhodomonas aquaeolei]MCS4504788.1 ATP-binding cassette domain-containing protein [Arhodomonas aquaeolei]QEA07375.1 high-affinity branched-chain amino acid transport ATP-binding protein LivF [uncultured organism]
MLRFEGINARIQGVPVLRDVDFTLEPGATVALIGRNGAGKTTTLRTVMGFIAPDSGSLYLGDRCIDDIPAHARPGLGIGYAPEDRRLFSAFNVRENILLPARAARVAPEEIRRRLDGVYEILPELRDMAERPGGTVSGGQGKMVALGRALMIGTRVVLLDEPFQGLAPALANRYAEALRTLRERDRDITLVITESNPALLRQFADRTLVIERGEVSEGSLERSHADAATQEEIS